jgi:kinetochore protein Spc25
MSMMCILRYYMFSVISVLDCDPHLNDTKELIHELNKTNGLFKFVRIMREKFQEAVAQGTILPLASYQAHRMPQK